MHRRWPLILLRGFLLSLFVLGGPGLPLIDAVVWHGSGSFQVAGSRLDAPGAARPHADTCSLAAPLPVPGPVPCAVSPALAFHDTGRKPEASAQVVRVTLTPDRSTRPRAPPEFSA
jgi:hypothetical protein